jgi:hypothetical protein
MPYTFGGISLPAHASGLQTSLEISYTTNALDVPVWADFSTYGQTVRTSRGRAGAFDQFKTGTAAIGVNNTARAFDKRYSSGPFYNSGTGLNPRKRVRWRFKYSTVEYTVFDGFLDKIVTSRDPANRVGWASLQVSDGFKIIAGASLPNGGTVVGDGDTAAVRLGRIADYIGWPAGDRDFDADSPALRALTLSGQKALGEAQLAAAADLGEMYMSRDNAWTYWGHRKRLSDSGSITSAATLGEDTAGGEYAYADLVVDDSSDELIFNRCTVTGTFAGVTVTLDVTDAASVTQFGPREKPLGTTILQNRNVAQNNVEWILAHFAQPIYRVKSLKIYPLVKPSTLIPFVLGLEVGDRITVKSRPMNLGSVDSQDVYVEGIDHDFNVNGDWMVNLSVSQANSSYWIIGTSKLGSSGTAIWA